MSNRFLMKGYAFVTQYFLNLKNVTCYINCSSLTAGNHLFKYFSIYNGTLLIQLFSHVKSTSHKGYEFVNQYFLNSKKFDVFTRIIPV